MRNLQETKVSLSAIGDTILFQIHVSHLCQETECLPSLLELLTGTICSIVGNNIWCQIKVSHLCLETECQLPLLTLLTHNEPFASLPEDQGPAAIARTSHRN